MTTSISNREDVIDSREVIERIEELENELEMACIDIDELEDGRFRYSPEKRDHEVYDSEEEAKKAAIDNAGLDDEVEELAKLKSLQEQCEGYSDWKHGEMLIRDDYFETYAQNLAEELGYIKRDVHWPYTCIDWEKAANELQMDYTSVDFDGATYWIRNC